MKHRFMLDLNIIYHAILGVDEHDAPDTTCAELLLLIGKNCHKIVVNTYLHGEYLARIYSLYNTKAPGLPPIFFVNQLLFKAEKFVQETEELPEFPADVGVPHEDIVIVKSALVSHPLLVAADAELRTAVNSNPSLRLNALSPTQALNLARDS